MNQNSHGIGLSLCQKISKGLNGSLTVKSIKNKGSVFTFAFNSDVIVDRRALADERMGIE